MNWYRSLETESITSHGQLMLQLINEFATLKKKKKPVGYLASVVQRPDESLRSWITRFDEALLVVEKHNLSTRMEIMYSNTVNQSLAKDLMERTPETELQLKELTARLANAEESYRTVPVRADRREIGIPRVYMAGPETEGGPKRFPNKNIGPNRARPGFTQLRQGRKEVLAAIQHESYLIWPEKEKETEESRNSKE